MTQRKPMILAVAEREEELARIRAMVGESHVLRALRPDRLSELGPWVDAEAALCVLEGAPEERSWLERLGELRASRAMVLLVEPRAPDEVLDERILQAKPRAVLEWPARPALLRHTLRLSVDPGDSSPAARHQQRPAAALLGVSAAMREVLEMVRRVAPSRMSLLILGETGTGKELVARAVHAQSPRSAAPFVAINCGALPESLLDAELFGFRRGAFTGASRDRIGLFERAHGGTLFLDEIGDTSLGMQVKLLRAIEAREIRPLGGSESREVDVRIVSATHRDIEDMVKKGDFREDLLYRLNTAVLHLPPLRRRRVDIPFLAQHFAEEFGAEQSREVVLSEEFLEVLSRSELPGNVRELRNAVERAITLAAADGVVRPSPLDLGKVDHDLRGGTLRERIDALETAAIRDALDEFSGNKTRASERLGLSRLGLRKKMSRLGIG